jgi:competence protein CoiA
VAKCGPKLAWHWAHDGVAHWDPWHESETQWHRDWKACFPAEWHEKARFDANGEKHQADVLLPDLRVIEVQNSPMSLGELRSRESFYGDMIWIVNGRKFIDQFFIQARIPPPEWSEAHGLFGFHSWWGSGDSIMFFAESDGSTPSETDGSGRVRENRHMEFLDGIFKGHYLFEWKQPRTVWYDATKPVYFDFGGDGLWQLLTYNKHGQRCVRLIPKADLVTEFGGSCPEGSNFVFPPGRPRPWSSVPPRLGPEKYEPPYEERDIDWSGFLNWPRTRVTPPA